MAGPAGALVPRAVFARRQAALRLLRAVPGRAEPARSRHPRQRGADRARSRPARDHHDLRPHLFDRSRARPDSRAGAQGRPEGHPGHLDRERQDGQPPPDRAGDRACRGVSRCHHRDRRRQRGAIARRDDRDGTRRHHPIGQGTGEGPGHLCRCLGILAAPPRDQRGDRLHHDSHPALLGGLSGSRRSRRVACRPDPAQGCRDVSGQAYPGRRDRLAERGADAGRRAALAHQPGARDFRHSRARPA